MSPTITFLLSQCHDEDEMRAEFLLGSLGVKEWTVAYALCRTLALKIEDIAQAIQDTTLGVKEDLEKLNQSFTATRIGTHHSPPLPKKASLRIAHNR